MKQENKNNKEEFSSENRNLEIISEKNNLPEKDSSDGGGSVSVSREGINVKKGGNIIIGSLNIVAEPFRHRHEKHYKESKFHLIADIAMVVVIIGLLTTFFAIKNFQPKLNIVLEAGSADKIITSGKIETFEIKYQNNSKETARDGNLAINFPKNFILIEASPKEIFNSHANTFRIGDLEAGANGKVKFSGMIWGEIGERQALTFSFNYSGLAGKERMLGSLVYLVENSVLTIDWQTPKEIYKNVDFLSKLIIKNSCEKDLEENVKIAFNNSLIEIKKTGSSRAVLNNNAINFSALKAGESLEMEVEAMTGADDGLIKTYLLSFINIGEKEIKQQEIKKEFLVSIPKFIVNILSDKKEIKEGDLINFKMNYENKESESATNVRFDVYSSDSSFNVSQLNLKSSEENFKVNGNTITLPGLLKSGEKGNLEFEVLFSRKKIENNQEVGAMVGISYEIGEKKVEFRVPSPRAKIFSDLNIVSKGAYYSSQGDQLGVGPLPPVVDVPTRYWIFWELGNFGNDLENLSVTGELTENVFWTDQKSLTAGKIRYGSVGKKVFWSVDKVEKEDGKGRAGFEVEFIPTKENLGKVVDLIDNLGYSAYDTFVGKEITGKLENINTDLKQDNLASGKGKVIKMEIIK